MPNVTIKDIAQAAGVSHPTVSKALNNAPGVNEETRRRILELARHMNYIPNIAARRLANHKNRSIGFIWPQAEGLFFYHLCSELQRQAVRRDIDVLVSMSDPVKALRTFNGHFIDFTLAWFFPDWVPGADLIKERELYTGEMMIVGGGQMEHACATSIDRAGGIYEAVAYLSGIGHKKIAYVGEQREKGGKIDGYLRGLLDQGLPHHPSRLITLDNKYYRDSRVYNREIAEKFTALWHGEHRPTALIIDSQDTAFGLIPCLNRLSISVPEDLSVVSYDDIPELSIYQAALTTCGPSIRDIVDSVLDSYEIFYRSGSPEQSLNRIVSSKLVIRDSTRRLSQP